MPQFGEWQNIETAPRDGTWIVGRDADGREAVIQTRKFHKFAPPMWFEGDPAKQGHWEQHKCFYPTEWRAMA